MSVSTPIADFRPTITRRLVPRGSQTRMPVICPACQESLAHERSVEDREVVMVCLACHARFTSVIGWLSRCDQVLLPGRQARTRVDLALVHGHGRDSRARFHMPAPLELAQGDLVLLYYVNGELVGFQSGRLGYFQPVPPQPRTPWWERLALIVGTLLGPLLVLGGAGLVSLLVRSLLIRA
jgi:hypothetical protein